jgi:anaerobic magnesium-protoporphyrin IX monomethyl ester cyclase
LDAYYLEEIENEKPLLLGFSPIDESFLRICHFIRKVKKRKIRSRIVLGGFFATLNHERIIRDYDLFDVIVRGEGEETLTEVALTLKQKGSLEKVRGITYRNGVKGIINESRPFIRDLDALPFPATDGYEEAQRKGMRMEQAVISTSRGCYRNCSFCSVRSFHDHDSSRRPWRARSTQHVVDEIETIHRTFGIPFFSLCDDNFIGPGERGKERAIEIADEILSRGLKISFEIFCRADNIEQDTIRALIKAGLTIAFFGMESGLQRVLNTFNKKTSVEQNERALSILMQENLSVVIGYIFFDPYLTPEELCRNAAYLERLLKLPIDIYPTNPLRSVVIPFSGTPILGQLRKDALLTGNYKRGYFYRFADKRIEDVFGLFKTIGLILENSAREKGRRDILTQSFKPQMRLLKHLGDAICRCPGESVEDILSEPGARKMVMDILNPASRKSETTRKARRPT